jgi:hypothetical protein
MLGSSKIKRNISIRFDDDLFSPVLARQRGEADERNRREPQSRVYRMWLSVFISSLVLVPLEIECFQRPDSGKGIDNFAQIV